METCWNNVKLDWGTLIEMLPNLLTKNGQYVYFGEEPDCTPYSICRARVGWRDCWIISDNGEASPSILMECSKKTDGYVNDLKVWLWDTLGLTWDDDVWVTQKVMGSE